MPGHLQEILLLQGTTEQPSSGDDSPGSVHPAPCMTSTALNPRYDSLLQVDVRVAQRIMNDVLGGDEAVAADADAEAEPGSPRAQP